MLSTSSLVIRNKHYLHHYIVFTLTLRRKHKLTLPEVMGPDESRLQLRSQQRFSWDIKYVRWTDGKGDLLEFSKSVERWDTFRDNILDNNRKKLAHKNRGVVLLSHLSASQRTCAPELRTTSSKLKMVPI